MDRRLAWAGALLAAAAVAVGAWAWSQRRPADLPPNVLLLVADDFGVDQLAAWREHPQPPRTPTLDGLVGAGVSFRNAWAYPDCSPTRAALLTGRYGRRTGVGQRVGNLKNAGKPFELPLDEVTLPEVLRGARTPYATSMVGKWHLTNFQSQRWGTHPNAQGFDWWAGTVGNLQNAWSDGRERDFFDWEKVVNGEVVPRARYVTTDETDDAIARIGEMREPWFLYAAFHAPHAPFHAPPPELLDADRPAPASTRAMYRAAVEALDREIGRLLASLPDDVRARTVVVFVGDNGTPKEAIAPPLDRRRGKNTLYEGGVRVPLVVAGPIATPGASSDALVHVVDLLPTMAELAGAPVPAEVDGTSLVPWLREPSRASPRDFLYTERFAPNGSGPYELDVRAVRDAGFKLVRGKDGSEQLFDLHATRWALDEGPDLLAEGEPSPEAAAALARLRIEMDRVSAELTYAHAPGTSEDDGAGEE